MKAESKKIYIESDKSFLIRKVSFIAFVMVVLIHSQVFALIDNIPTQYKNVQSFLFRDLTAWAVPYFFSASGFFFSKRIFSVSKGMVNPRDFWRKFLIGKMKSLLVPYILWATICTIMSLPIVIGTNYFSGRSIFANILYKNDLLIDILGVFSWKGPQFAGHLWFLRTLMILFLISPFTTIP